jgi:hypothetical protein
MNTKKIFILFFHKNEKNNPKNCQDHEFERIFLKY